MAADIRVLLLADSHLGFDLPVRARVTRRRRGHDFLANYVAALAPAFAGAVDVVVHGGDVFDRSRVPKSLAYQAFEPLNRVAERGVPVFIVPGNHERARLPHRQLARHANVHVFDRPRTFTLEVGGHRLGITGFPFERRAVRRQFSQLLERTDWFRSRATLRLLCLHQCVEGATVGPGDFTFTSASDVIRCRDIPAGFAAVLSGHIHRHQVLTRSLDGSPLSTAVLYPGSIERTSIAEVGEPKGYLIVDVSADGDGGRVRWEFQRLPARPMIVRQLVADGLSPGSLESALHAIIGAVPPDAVLRIRVAGQLTEAQSSVLTSARLRVVAPASMNVEIRTPDGFRFRRNPREPRRASASNLELEFG